MVTSREFSQRLRALSMTLATLECTVGRCSRELNALIDLAARFDRLDDHSLRSKVEGNRNYKVG
jgi:hypothetical protein